MMKSQMRIRIIITTGCKMFKRYAHRIFSKNKIKNESVASSVGSRFSFTLQCSILHSAFSIEHELLLLMYTAEFDAQSFAFFDELNHLYISRTSVMLDARCLTTLTSNKMNINWKRLTNSNTFCMLCIVKSVICECIQVWIWKLWFEISTIL